MASINYATREIQVKVVYYGPGLSGKTTNLQIIHKKVPDEHKSDMVSLATETDRTLFFDFLPLDLGTIKGFSTKFQLYTVPGQVYYNATRKLVLRGVDGIVFVVDSGADKVQENLESFQNLEDNLTEYGYDRQSIAIVLQYNKRDLPNALPIEELENLVNKYRYPWFEAVANKGKGVFETLKVIGKLVMDKLNKRYTRPATTTVPVLPRPAAPQQMPPPRPVAPAPIQNPAVQQVRRPVAPQPMQAAPQMPPQQQQRPAATSGFAPQNDPFLDSFAPQEAPTRQSVQPMAPQQMPPLQQAPQRAPAPRQAQQQQDVSPVDQSFANSSFLRLDQAPPPPPRQKNFQPRTDAFDANNESYALEDQSYSQNQQSLGGGYQKKAPTQPIDQSFDYGEEELSIQLEPMIPPPRRPAPPPQAMNPNPPQRQNHGMQQQASQQQTAPMQRRPAPIAPENQNSDQDFGIWQPPAPPIAPRQLGGAPALSQQNRPAPRPAQQMQQQDDTPDFDMGSYQKPTAPMPSSRGSRQFEDDGQQQQGDGPLYFTSVNTDKQKKKNKPVNPKNKPSQDGFLSKFFKK